MQPIIAQDAPVYRALLIACDDFVSYPDTFPSSHNNLTMMRDMFSRDTRSFVVHWQDGITQNVSAVESAVGASFKGARDGDVSYIYLSTHGIVTEEDEPAFGLVLSDGFEEEVLYADKLKEMLDEVSGTKVIIADACYSGNLLETFAEPEYIVFASSRDDEKSWYWNAEQGRASDNSASSLESLETNASGTAMHTTLGESYYTQALTTGAGRFGEFSSDKDADGSITLAELSEYMKTAHAASEAQMYVGADAAEDFVFTRYDQFDADGVSSAEKTLLTDFVFDDMNLSAQKRSCVFSFAANESVRVGYQYVIFDKDKNQWDWETAVMWMDSELKGGANAIVPRRRIFRTVTLNGIDKEDDGIIMMSVVAFDEYGHPTICASRILKVNL
jgi:hypothetical protein